MHPFVQKLADRKLIKWALAYGAGAFVVVQLMDAIAEPLGLAVGVQQGILTLLGVGFPVALVLAWYHGEQGRQRVHGLELGLIAILLALGGGLVTIWDTDGRPDESPPLVLMMDSHHPRRVYDQETIDAGGTNADVVSDILLDLPIRRQRESVGLDWHRDEEMLRFAPDLVIIHYSAFRQLDDEGPRLRLRQFLEFFADSDTQFLIYSRRRGTWLRDRVDELLSDLDQQHPGLFERIHTFALFNHGEPTFRAPVTGTAPKLRVKTILGLD